MILITGANGLVGSAVASKLVGRAPMRLALHRANPDELGAAGVRFDFRDPSTFEVALRGVSRVFLMRPARLAHARHDFGPFVAAMRAAHVEQVVFLSVRGADRNPLLPHRRIERLLGWAGLACTHLRPNDFMQNLTTVHQSDIRDRGEIWVPAGRGRTSFVDARDVAAVAARVLTEPGHAGRAYTLTGSEALSMETVAAILSEQLGQVVTYKNPGIPGFLSHLRSTGRLNGLGFVMIGVYTLSRLGLAAAVTTDLEKLLGRPPTTLRRFVADNVVAWRQSDEQANVG